MQAIYRKGKFTPIFLVFMCLGTNLFAQPVWTFDPFGKESTDTKSEEYKERLLPSERTANKKFTWWRKFVHNNVTHYNYYFNANNKLNLVLETARESQQDDYTKLLSFYPISLDNTSSQATELDSVIYKSTAGILMHDLRTDWVDNLYLLIGQSYYYRKDFDSAVLTFQFINYNLFPRKKKEDENRVIGENERAQSSTLSIADREKRNFIQKLFTLPPSRNDALIWLARTFIEQEKYGESAGLISILQNDPNLPKRLRPTLHEVNAYWFYRQEQYDSAAIYLEKSIKGISNKADKARQMFLLAQLFEHTRQFDKASSYYKKSAQKTSSPLMDISAHLNNAKMMRTAGNIKELDNSIARLKKMATKDKYEAYRDIIYYSAAMLSLQRPDTANAVSLFQKSLLKNENNTAFRNKAHLMLGKIAYQQHSYKEAADRYDSIDVFSIDPTLEDTADILVKKNALRRVADYLNEIQQADSLMMLSMLPTDQLDAFIKKQVKKAKKQASKEAQYSEEEDNNLLMLNSNINKDGTLDLFNAAGKGEWYFYNTSMKSKGFNEFKTKWGKRSNVDNWRRKSAMSILPVGNQPSLDNSQDPLAPSTDQPKEEITTENSYEQMMGNVPLTDEQKAVIHQKTTDAMINLAQVFEMELLDFNQAINTYDIYLQRFPDSLRQGQIYLSLHHCYAKLGDSSMARYYRHLLDSLFSDSKYLTMLKNPQALQPEKNNDEFEKNYTRVYNLMQEEKFEEAMALKEKMDCDYGDHYWTPQMLYMWGVYAVKCASDSQAIYLLNSLKNNYPGSVLAEKAERLIDALTHRKEIETHLNELNVVRAAPDPKLKMPKDSDRQNNNSDEKTAPPTASDDVTKQPEVIKEGSFVWDPQTAYQLAILTDKIDPVYINETIRGVSGFNQQKGKTALAMTRNKLTPQQELILLGSFKTLEEASIYQKELKAYMGSGMSWLDVSKYKIFPVTEANSNEVIKNPSLITEYLNFLQKQLPGKY